MKTSIFCWIFVSLTVFTFALPSVPDIYEVIQSQDTVKINAALASIEKSTSKEKEAYTGTLLMKKSGMIRSGMDKLSMFKKGRKLLEASIKLDSANAEYRFLRLIIQENAPDFMNYHSKKEVDSKMIKEQYTTLPLPLREAIKKYSHNSHVLKPEDFQK